MRILIFIFTFSFFFSNIAMALDSSGLGVSGRLTSNISQSSQGVPIGSVIAWTTHGMPSDGEWLECNGQYHGSPELFNVIGSWYTPNYQGMFLRGYGEQRHLQVNGSIINKGQPTETIHKSDELGKVQGDAIRNITGKFIGYDAYANDASWWQGAFYSGRTWPDVVVGGDDGERETYFNASRVVPTATENRPANVAVKYIIKIK